MARRSRSATGRRRRPAGRTPGDDPGQVVGAGGHLLEQGADLRGADQVVDGGAAPVGGQAGQRPAEGRRARPRAATSVGRRAPRRPSTPRLLSASATAASASARASGSSGTGSCARRAAAGVAGPSPVGEQSRAAGRRRAARRPQDCSPRAAAPRPARRAPPSARCWRSSASSRSSRREVAVSSARAAAGWASSVSSASAPIRWTRAGPRARTVAERGRPWATPSSPSGHRARTRSAAARRRWRCRLHLQLAVGDDVHRVRRRALGA